MGGVTIPDLAKDLLINILNIIILFVIVKTLIYKPVKKFLDARTKRINDAKNELEEKTKQVQEKLDAIGIALFNQAQGVAEALVVTDLIGAEGKVGNHHRGAEHAGHAAGVVDHLVEGDGQGRVVALHRHPQRVAHEHERDGAGLERLDERGAGGVITGDRSEGALALQLPQFLRRPSAHSGSCG